MHSRKLPSDTSLPDELNHFDARFEASNTEACMRASAFPDDCVITLSVADVSKTFKQVNIHKAAESVIPQSSGTADGLMHASVMLASKQA